MMDGQGLAVPMRELAVPEGSTVAAGRFPRLRRGLRVLGMAVGVPVLALGLYVGVVRVTGNFHEVEPQLLYRSAQLDGATLRAVTRRYGIRSVLSLRGGRPGDTWFDEETQVLRELGLHQYVVRISARYEVGPEQLDDIVRLMRAAPKPLLVHCNAGSDRTGLVIAAYALRQGVGLATAQQQLSLRYGHFPWLGSPSIAMDRSLLAYGRNLRLLPEPVAELR